MWFVIFVVNWGFSHPGGLENEATGDLSVELGVELTGPGQKFVFGCVVGIHNRAGDDFGRDFGMMRFEIAQKLFHGASFACAASKNNNLIGALKGFGDRFVIAFRFVVPLSIVGLARDVGVKMTAVSMGIIGFDLLGHSILDLGAINLRLVVVNYNEQMKRKRNRGRHGKLIS